MHTNDLRKLACETNDSVLRGPALGAADEIDRLRAEIVMADLFLVFIVVVCFIFLVTDP